MRRSDAGHMGAGPGLSSGHECDGLGLLSKQARSSPVLLVCPAMYLVSVHNSRLVCESIVSLTTVMVPMGPWHQQLARTQLYLVDLAMGLQQWYPVTLLQGYGYGSYYLLVEGYGIRCKAVSNCT